MTTTLRPAAGRRCPLTAGLRVASSRSRPATATGRTARPATGAGTWRRPRPAFWRCGKPDSPRCRCPRRAPARDCRPRPANAVQGKLHHHREQRPSIRRPRPSSWGRASWHATSGSANSRSPAGVDSVRGRLRFTRWPPLSTARRPSPRRRAGSTPLQGTLLVLTTSRAGAEAAGVR